MKTFNHLNTVLFILLLALVMLLTGCNTIEGAGEDIQAAGEEIEEDAKN